MTNAEVLQKIGNLKPESVSNILAVVDFMGIGDFVEATAEYGMFWQTVVVTCSGGRKFLFGLSTYGFVEMVRADSADGDIDFIPED